jgi:hypothetical protein
MEYYIVTPKIEVCKECLGSDIGPDRQCPRCLGSGIDPGGHAFTVTGAEVRPSSSAEGAAITTK